MLSAREQGGKEPRCSVLAGECNVCVLEKNREREKEWQLPQHRSGKEGHLRTCHSIPAQDTGSKHALCRGETGQGWKREAGHSQP